MKVAVFPNVRRAGAAGAVPRFLARGLAPSLIAVAALAGAAADALAAQPARWIAGRVVVHARAGVSDLQMARIAGAHGGSVQRIGRSNLFIVDLPRGISEVAVHKLLARHPHLKFAELDGLVSPSLSSNDPYLGSEWHIGKIGASSAWDVSLGSNTTIAVLDTGVDATHPDLASSIVPGWNFYANTADTGDVYNHGTAVAGAAAASINNAIGVAGVAGKAQIMPIKVSDDTGTGSWSAMAQGLTYAADKGVRVANISYMVGGVASVQSAAQYMKNKNGLVFVSAGNTGAEVTYAATSTLVPVAATDSADARSSFSTYGAYVALAAPGQGIYTLSKGGGYQSASGTSFSSPVAAGVAALVMAANPQLSSSQVESILYSTALDLGAAGRDPYFGWGRVNANAAVQAALTTVAVDTVPPTASIAAPLASSTVSGLVNVDVGASDNVAVTRVDLLVNGTVVASDSVAPFALTWDSTSVANGMSSLAVVAYDAAGNQGTSASVSVNVANAVAADTAPPAVAFAKPLGGAVVSGTVSVTTSASDNAGSTGITQVLYIDGRQVASATGASLSYSWNTRKLASGNHSLTVRAVDAAGNASSSSISVTR